MSCTAMPRCSHSKCWCFNCLSVCRERLASCLACCVQILTCVQDAEEIRDPFWEVRWSALRTTLVRKLGAGSAGQVYEAYFMGAPVAVKILKNVDASGQ